MSKTEVTVSNRTIVRVLAIIIATYVSIRIIVDISHVLELIIIAIFLALALNPAVSNLSKYLRLKHRALATIITFLAFIVIIGGLLSLVVPTLVRQTVDFVREAPNTISALKDENTTAGRLVKRYRLQGQIDGLSQNLHDRTKNISEPVITTASRVGGALIAILTVLVMTVMILLEGPTWLKRYFDSLPKARQKHHKVIANKMYGMVTGYVNGQVLLALISATFYFFALVIISTIFKVSINAVALAGILFFTGLIPMVGHLIGGAIIFVACLFVSLPLALSMVAVMLVYQQLENVTLQPYIQAKYNELTPLLVIIAALVGISIAGLLGGFIAIPVAGCIRILIQDYSDHRENQAA